MLRAARKPSCALVALVLPAALEEDVALERVLARERAPALADVRLGVAVHVLVPLEVVVALECGLADAADVRAGRVGGRGRGRGRARGGVGAVQVCGGRVVGVAGAITSGDRKAGYARRRCWGLEVVLVRGAHVGSRGVVGGGARVGR